MTRDEFLQDMKKGWEKLDYTSDKFYDVEYEYGWSNQIEEPTQACAIGAAAYGAKRSAVAYGFLLPGNMWNKIARASNAAGSKEAAIAEIEALSWEDEQ